MVESPDCSKPVRMRLTVFGYSKAGTLKQVLQSTAALRIESSLFGSYVDESVVGWFREKAVPDGLGITM